MIDVGILRSLIAVRDSGSVAAAADVLGFTPSAVSQQIKRLERQTGSVLLERVGRGVILTEHGRVLAEKGGELLADLEALEGLAQSPDAPVRGSLRLAAFSTSIRGLVIPLLSRLREVAPELRVTLEELDPWDSITAVERGVADLAVVHDWNTVLLDVPQGVETELLTTDRADVLLRHDHPLAAAASVTPAQLAGETWVSIPVGSICHEWLCRMFAATGHSVNIAYFDSDFTTHVAMVDQGLAAALVPRLGREGLPEGVVAVPVTSPAPTRIVQAAWRRSTAANPALQLVKGHLIELAGEV